MTPEWNLVAANTLTPSQHGQLALLLATPKGTVVLDRDFGVDISCLDNPAPIARSMLAGELAAQIDRYIPELSLREVQLLDMNQDGRLRLKVVVTDG